MVVSGSPEVKNDILKKVKTVIIKIMNTANNIITNIRKFIHMISN